MSFQDFVANSNEIIVLDGGMGSELEHRGCDLSGPLWSGRVLLEHPEIIVDVHRSYLQAGARCLITSSYQLSIPALMQKHGMREEEAAAAIQKSVLLAQRARELYRAGEDGADPLVPIFVAGSVGPYGAFLTGGSEYRGDYDLECGEFQDFHRGRVAELVTSGVDVLAIETQPSFNEVSALVKLLESEFPDTVAWVTFTMSSTHPTSHIADGTTVEKVAKLLNESPQVVAMGANCIPIHHGAPVLAQFAAWTKKPLILYPNSGAAYDPLTKTWPRISHDGHGAVMRTLASESSAWIREGARFIGGCCLTGPADIEYLCHAIHMQLKEFDSHPRKAE